ncbi:MAG: hypothetical protein R3D60_05090 [Paracoccaceae bacterium]
MNRRVAPVIHVVAVLSVVLGACASPDWRFRTAPRQDIRIDGRLYAVYVTPPGRDRQVQVIRLGWARRGDHVAILAAMRQAAVQASACALVEGSDQGDSGVMTARLDCP